MVASTRLIDVAGTWHDTCATDGVYTTYASGTFVVDLVFSNLEPTTTVDASALTVLYVPFDGQGDPPKLIIVPLGTSDNG